MPAVTLLDLPDELLDQILGELKWGAPAPTFELDGLDFYESLARNTSNIQRVRLTCRRLALLASALLLPIATVSLCDPSSVDRLEQIARHEVLAPHVKAVHAYFAFYEDVVAMDMRELARHLVRVWRDSELPAGSIWLRVFDDWEAFSQDPVDAVGGAAQTAQTEQTRESMQLLLRLYLEYRRRFHAQPREGGYARLIQRIARAMAQMPRATRLILDDAPDLSRMPDLQPTSNTAVVCLPAAGELEWLVTPTAWATALEQERSAPPIEPLFALPLAVHHTGTALTGLRIHRLPLPSTFPLWVGRDPDWDRPPPPEAEELRKTCRWLRVFQFTPDYEPWDWRAGPRTVNAWPGRPDFLFLPWTRIGEVLEWILFAAGDLTDIELNLEKLSFGGDLNGILPLPCPLPWPSLRALHLRNGNLDSTALAHCLEVTSGTLTQLHLNQMRLGPGSWAE